jgi:predicted aspartyl protease
MKLRHLALGLAALPLAPAPAETLELTNNRLLLNVRVNGERTVALLDSGAEMTIIDDDFDQRLGLAAVGSATAHGSGAATMEARFADHVAIEAVGVAFETRVGILDLGEVSRRLLGRGVTMLLGRDLFDRGRLRIDIMGATIALAGAVPAGGVRLPVSTHRGIPAIPASIEGREPVQAVFDLGNGSDVLIGRAYAERIGLAAPERIVGQSGGGGLGGERRRDIVVLRNIVLAGREYRDVRAAIDPGETASDLNIGTSILRDFIITTDFAGGAIWLEPREPTE